ncbi:MAG: hypothetical protein ABSG59_02440 [Verrucomicrobiota bacterium]|jgi:hypothetical protein
MSLFTTIMGGLCFPLDVIWKHHMGERYCTWIKLIVVTFAMHFGFAYITIFYMAQGRLTNPRIIPARWDDPVYAIAYYGMTLATWIFAVKNLLEIRRRKKAGIRLHSYYIGTPRFLPDKPIVQSFVIPAGSFLAGLLLYQIVRPIGVYVCIAAVFQRWVYSRLYKEERTRQMDQQDRELLNAWRSGEAGRHAPPTVVQVAKQAPGAHSGAAEESAFNERWQQVLKRPTNRGG